MPRVVKHIRRTIPGGGGQLIELLRKENKDTLEAALYNWLRSCRSFSEVTISLSNTPDTYKVSKTKVVEFSGKGPAPVWEVHAEGRLYLAKTLANVISSNRFVYLTVDKNGVNIFQDVTNQFGPLRTASQADVDAWAETFPDTDCPYAVGQKIPTDDWEPYLDFIPSNRSEYGRGSV